MRESNYDLLCAVLLGLGQLCMFLGYDTQLTIVESVMHSVHDRSPETMDAHGGYYGLAFANVIFTLANLAAPWALGILGSKYSLLLGSSLFTLHIATFFYVHWIPYYITSALLGFGYALYYTGFGAYTTEHSTTTTIERNSAVTWSIATSCMAIGGVVLLFTMDSSAEEVGTAVLSNATHAIRSYRVYSDSEIRIMYGAFFAVAVGANVIFAFIPTRAVKDSIATLADSRNHIGFLKNLKITFSTMCERYMVQMIPLFFYIGMGGCIWCSVYPTTLMFTRKLSDDIYLPAKYSIVLGLGDMLTGFVIGAVCKRVHNFSKLPTLTIGCISFSTAMTLVLLSTPTWSTTTPNDDGTLLIEPNFYLPLLIAFLFGIGDNCVNTSRTVICALILHEKRAQVFSISKFHQSLIGAVVMFLSPFFSVYVYFALMLGLGISSCELVFFYEANLEINKKVVSDFEKK
ncbi:hypothetical protein PMAYCL1PPCAC_15178, partial [Pristionchus mayeri]